MMKVTLLLFTLCLGIGLIYPNEIDKAFSKKTEINDDLSRKIETKLAMEEDLSCQASSSRYSPCHVDITGW